MATEDFRSLDPTLRRYDGLAAAIANDQETYEGFLGMTLGQEADYLFPDLPTFAALNETSKKNVSEKHLVDPNFLQGALQGLISARKERGAKL